MSSEKRTFKEMVGEEKASSFEESLERNLAQIRAAQTDFRRALNFNRNIIVLLGVVLAFAFVFGVLGFNLSNRVDNQIRINQEKALKDEISACERTNESRKNLIGAFQAQANTLIQLSPPDRQPALLEFTNAYMNQIISDFPQRDCETLGDG